ncbi:MAG: oligosaccharide flippase family protein, partial [Clostridia bacterium]|nr:oligosaccharide flippase family protein [Clostridia bacterium]
MKNTGTYPLSKLRCGLAEKINAPARASAAFVAINLASKLAALVFTPIFTRLLSTESYGIYSLFISTLSVLLVLCSLELSGGVIMRVMQRKRELSHLVLSTAYVLCIIATVPVLAIWYAIGRSDAVSFPFAFPILALMLISQAIISLYLSHARFLYKWQSAAVAAVIQSIGAPILGIALIRLISPADTMHITLKLGAAAVALALLAACFAASTVRGAVREAHKYGLCAKGLTREMLSIARLCLGLSLP